MDRPDRSRLRLLALILADLLAINLAYAAAYWLRYEYGLGGRITAFNDVPYLAYLPWGLALSLILVPAYRVEGLYHNRRRQSLPESVYAITTGTLVGVSLLTVVLYGVRPVALGVCSVQNARGRGMRGAHMWSLPLIKCKRCCQRHIP